MISEISHLMSQVDEKKMRELHRPIWENVPKNVSQLFETQNPINQWEYRASGDHHHHRDHHHRDHSIISDSISHHHGSRGRHRPLDGCHLPQRQRLVPLRLRRLRLHLPSVVRLPIRPARLGRTIFHPPFPPSVSWKTTVKADAGAGQFTCQDIQRGGATAAAPCWPS